MGEALIPPWVRPESPETLRLIDDATTAFAPAFGRGMTQRGIFADPRWGFRRRYRGLRGDEQAAILNALSEKRGQFNILRVVPHTPLRGTFPTTELLTNNSFASGTTGWASSNGTQMTISASDRVLRLTRLATNSAAYLQPSTPGVTVSQYAPYVMRGFSRSGSGNNRGDVRLGSTSTGSELGLQSFGPDTTYGMMVASGVAPATTIYPAVSDYAGGGSYPRISGEYSDITYLSLTRCALIDGGGNSLLYSDQFNQANWTKTAVTISADTGLTAAPDGTSTADNIVETTATSVHSVSQSATFPSAADDLCYAVALKVNGRTNCWLQLSHGTGTSFAFFNLSTGVVGSTSTGSGWSGLRTFTVDMGNGWFYFCIVVRKTSADTSVTAQHGGANGDGVSSYTGSTSAGLFSWRATLRTSGVPARLTESTSAQVAAQSPTGAGMYSKGWPASTSNLLIVGDWFEVAGELKRVTAPVTSDASGRAYIQFRPGLAGTHANDEPIVIAEPFGRFIYPGTCELENLFGIYGDCEMNLEEIYS